MTPPVRGNIRGALLAVLYPLRAYARVTEPDPRVGERAASLTLYPPRDRRVAAEPRRDK
jgi:hypothetical protein